MATIQRIIFALLIAGIAASLTALALMALSTAAGSRTTVYHGAQLVSILRGGIL